MAHEAHDVIVATQDRPAAVTIPPVTGALPLLRHGRGDRNSVLYLQEKLIALQLLDAANGVFDEKTEAAVTSFQRRHKLVVDGIVGAKTWATINAALSGNTEQPNSRWLSDADLEDAAERLDVELPTLRAVYKVESNGRGFVGDHPKILFEGHVFWKRLQLQGLDPQQLAAGNADILYPKWTKAHYGNAAHERDRLRRAEAIHEVAARESASWGLFQIMGYHWKTLNDAMDVPKYGSVNDFVACMSTHERDQLEAFCYFILVTKSRGTPLVDLLRAKDWAGFAYGYNGTGYRANAYDDKLRAAYLAFKAQAGV